MIGLEVEGAYLWAVPGNELAETFYRHRGWLATADLMYVPTAAGDFPLRKWVASLSLGLPLLAGR
jgi:hypothetical protein